MHDFISEFSRVLKPGGILCVDLNERDKIPRDTLSTYTRDNPDGPALRNYFVFRREDGLLGVVYFFSKPEIEALLNLNNLSPVHIQPAKSGLFYMVIAKK
jgi:SAM-dependent methyltransferase